MDYRVNIFNIKTRLFKHGKLQNIGKNSLISHFDID